MPRNGKAQDFEISRSFLPSFLPPPRLRVSFLRLCSDCTKSVAFGNGLFCASIFTSTVAVITLFQGTLCVDPGGRKFLLLLTGVLLSGLKINSEVGAYFRRILHICLRPGWPGPPL